MTFTASDVLLKAASRIEEEGMWCQGVFYLNYPMHDVIATAKVLHENGTRVAECAFGALVSVALELGDPRLATLAEMRLRAFVGSPSGFNDAPGRTAHEVAAAMREAAL